MPLDEILDKAKEKAGNITEKITYLKDDLIGDEQKEIISEFKESGLNKVRQIMDDIYNSLTLISKSGYEFKGLGASLGLPPVISMNFNFKREISAEDKAALFEEAKDKKIISLILKMLFKASDFYHSLKMGEYILDFVGITLGLTPGVNVNFKKK